MLQVNLVQVFFSSMTWSMILLGGLINSFEEKLPIFLRQTFRYGKFAYNGEGSIFKPLKVPKSFFKHFYVYSAVLLSCTTISMIFILLLNFDVPDLLYKFLDLSCGGPNRRVSVNSASSLLAMVLLTLQCCRRFYETHFVSIFGKNSQMDWTQYVIGYLHYTGAVIAILAETAGFVSKSSNKHLFRVTDLTNVDFFATVLFLWAFWHQYKTAVILANLRKNKKGAVVTEDHKLPYGDWFDHVTSPHLLAEILMYFSLTIILWNNITWLYVFAWVLTNQVEVALLNHWWYEETFENYPKNRKIIIPFVY